jgi:Tol biopolymer transport system component
MPPTWKDQRPTMGMPAQLPTTSKLRRSSGQLRSTLSRWSIYIYSGNSNHAGWKVDMKSISDDPQFHGRSYTILTPVW